MSIFTNAISSLENPAVSFPAAHMTEQLARNFELEAGEYSSVLVLIADSISRLL